MKLTLPAALAISLTVAVSALAAEKAAKKKKPGTLPPTSKMIEVPPADPASKGDEPQKLISSEMSGQDLQFFTTAVESGRFQVYLVDLLKTKAQSEQIKALAGALAGTQEQENRQIARLAAAKGWTVSTEPTAAQKAVGAELEKQAGANFDKAVMDKVITASQQSVSAYEAAAHSTDKEIKNFSEQMLPLAKEKLLLVERMTGAGKSAAQFFRTGAPPKPAPAPGATPKSEPTATPAKPVPGATPKTEPAATPSKPNSVATPTAKPATTPAAVATPAPKVTPGLGATPRAATPPSGPQPIPPPITK